MKSRTKKQTSAAAQPPAQGPRPGARWRRWLLVGALGLLAAATTWALFEYVIWNTVPGALVGKWVVIEGDQEGATFDFYRGGTMVGRVNVNGREGIIRARVRVEGTTILSTTQNPHTGQNETRRQKITRLTARELVIEDERGQLLKMERAE